MKYRRRYSLVWNETRALYKEMCTAEGWDNETDIVVTDATRHPLRVWPASLVHVKPYHNYPMIVCVYHYCSLRLWIANVLGRREQ